MDTSRGGSASGSRGRGRNQSENQRQNRSSWQSSGQNRQYGEGGGPQYGSGSALRANPAAYHEAGQGYSGPLRPNPAGENRPAQSAPPRATHAQSWGQGRSFREVALSQPATPGGNGGSGGRGSCQGRSFSEVAMPQPATPGGNGGSGGRGSGWGRGGRGGTQNVVRQPSSEPASSTTTVAMEPLSSELKLLKISTSLVESDSLVPIKRPDKGGQTGIRQIQLLTNHFLVSFDPQMKIYHYNLDIQAVIPNNPEPVPIKSKSESLLVKKCLFAKFPELFPESKTVYDGKQNLFSAVELQQCGKFAVDVIKGEDVKPRVVVVKWVASLDLNMLCEYFRGTLTSVPREILQAMDVVMLQNPSLSMIPVGRCFYSKRVNVDLRCGVIASTGLHHSLKTTAQGVTLCMDYTAISFFKRMPVLDFLRLNLGIPLDANTKLDQNQKKLIEDTLRGLKVTVNHRKTNQKYVVTVLTRDNAYNLKFDIDTVADSQSKSKVSVADYFLKKYDKKVAYKWLPCLDFSKNKRTNYVPMEYCELVEGQRYPKEFLRGNAAKALKEMTLIKPWERQDRIRGMITDSDGPCGGGFADEFHIGVSNNMTQVTGRVLKQPVLKIRNSSDQCVKFTPKEDGQWNMLSYKVCDGKQVDRWAILDFTAFSHWDRLNVSQFIRNISDRATRIGVRVNRQPLFCESASMNVLSNEKQLYNILKHLFEKAEGKLQILFCPMEKRHLGYNTLKRICETEIGMVSQCCLSPLANEGKDQYFVNLAFKINTKLGGSNMELFHSLPCLDYNHHVMFMGADVNHPSSRSTSGISIAAVTASMNWPGANRYAFRLRAQPRRTEKILEIGAMCSDLIETYAQKNGIKPQKIILFRDGVSDSQFEMVLNEELDDIKKAIEMDGYKPTITVVVAQKRHQTRFFPKNRMDGGKTGNIPPGTVVDTGITHPDQYDFYLCSHFGSIGTSKPTHYHVLMDDHHLSSDDLQSIIYNLCYTFPRCTKPVSLVPPVFFADLAAYRGRQYEDSKMHSPPSSSSSSSGSSSSSSSMASNEINNFPKVHVDLKNLMIFC